ncbi:MAG TPA: ATP-binding protein [Vicinamibacterales bacterium]|nr:ATP-binding protein [Vicinamibacterales bacterium]
MIEAVFPGNTEMARRMRALDWSTTPFGPVEQWPQSLRTSVATCLDCAFPIVLWWGPELAILYNDEYRPMLGPAKHPAALGVPGAQVWSEIWDVIAPMLSQVYERGEATRSRDLLLHIDRGYSEEAYFSFSYSPIRDEAGKVAGIFCPVIETTEKIIGERRLRTLRDLAARCKGAESEQSACEAAAALLAANPHDVPFALIYRVDEKQSSATLKAVAGIAPGTDASPEVVALNDPESDLWSLGAVAQSGQITTRTSLSQRVSGLPAGAWKTPPHTAIVLPVLLPGQEHPRAILVAAVSPMRALDDGYRTFFGLIATQLASALADAEALEAERRRAEALAELDRVKTAFFSNVSHEFRTPLTLMLGPLHDVLAGAGGALNADARVAVDVAHRNGLRLLKLVNTLLDFSRLEAGRLEASFEPTDLAAFTSELASVFRSAIEKAGLELLVECDPLPAPVYVDRDMWEKILLNLLSNAFKFTFEGRITVTLRWRDDRVELAVSDTGIGIAESDLPRLFERFHRVKHARARTHEGTGIGLALVQELVRLHGGTVAVLSDEGRGTAFTVSIRTGTAHLPTDHVTAARLLTSTGIGTGPFVEEALRWLPSTAGSDHPDTEPTTVTEAVAASAEGSPRVLIADDNADMRDYLARILGQSYRVEVVADGAAALQRVRANPPDLVLTDVMMPTLDGFGLLAAIRADQRSRTIPVVLLSARAGEEARIEGLHAGADEYLVKPFSARELLACVASQLQLQQLRRDADQALRYRSEQYETLLNQAPLGVYVVDAEFRIRDVNPMARPVFEGIPDGVIGRDFEEIVRILWKRERADEVVRIFRQTLVTGEPYVAPEGDEFRIDRGLTEYYEWRVDPITLPDGRGGLVCYFKDITKRKQAELERLRLVEENAAVTETLNEVGAIVASDLDRTRVVQAVTDAGTELTAAQFGAFFYNLVNEAGESFTLYTMSGAARESFSTFPMPRNTEVFDPTFKGTGVVRSADITQDPRYGHNPPYNGMPPGHLPVRSYLAVPVKGRAGDVIGGLFFGHPETGRFSERHERLAVGIASWASVALENASLYMSVQEASRLKDDFLASLSHELRTPLNAILGYARMLRTGIMAPARHQKAIEIIERNATSLTQIVEDVLDISRIVSGKIRLNVQAVDFPDVVRSAIDAIALAADAKGVRVETVLDPQATPISGDPERLQQVLWNLLSNAVKFTNRGGKVQVHLERVNSHVELTVSDTGIGIRPEFIPHLFERFRQADGGITRERGGLGLGLSIARQLTEMHGGTIEAFSEGSGRGSMFRLRIPLMVVYPAFDEQPRIHPRTGASGQGFSAGDLQHVHVLAVDDERDALSLVAEVLEAAGARVTTARSVDDALARLDIEVPDVVVADIGMPHLDGFHLIDRLRRHHNPRVRELPAVALTAYARSDDRMKALRAGFHIHLAKPIDPAELVATIAAITRRFQRQSS